MKGLFIIKQKLEPTLKFNSVRLTVVTSKNQKMGHIAFGHSPLFYIAIW